jgi:hypothetical protein
MFHITIYFHEYVIESKDNANFKKMYFLTYQTKSDTFLQRKFKQLID